MKKETKLLHNATFFLIIIIAMYYAICVITAIVGIVLLFIPDRPDTFSTLGEISLIIFSALMAAVYVPAIYAAKYGRKYITEKNYENLEKCSKWGFITLGVTLVITKMIGITLSALLYLPIITYLIGCHKEREQFIKKS